MEQPTDTATATKEASVEPTTKPSEKTYWIGNCIRYAIDAWLLWLCYRHHVDRAVLLILGFLTITVESHSHWIRQSLRHSHLALRLIVKLGKAIGLPTPNETA